MLNEKQLQKIFERINKRKLNNHLLKHTIKIKRMKRSLGIIYCSKRVIKLSDFDFAEGRERTNLEMKNTLIHEIAHAELYYKQGQKEKNKHAHTKEFWNLVLDLGGEIDEIDQAIFRKAQIVAQERGLIK